MSWSGMSRGVPWSITCHAGWIGREQLASMHLGINSLALWTHLGPLWFLDSRKGASNDHNNGGCARLFLREQDHMDVLLINTTLMGTKLGWPSKPWPPH
ncbi:hypothetical protein D5086_015078 [Populus alba]|uniref:Uncharacterized protein n=1 Tax=Populus alba TaxID=43335 RepID=A0ACC4C0V1_POPAL